MVIRTRGILVSLKLKKKILKASFKTLKKSNNLKKFL
jgi:hypothetical protein